MLYGIVTLLLRVEKWGVGEIIFRKSTTSSSRNAERTFTGTLTEGKRQQQNAKRESQNPINNWSGGNQRGFYFYEVYWFVTSLPNGSAEMLSLLRTHTEQLKWTSKREMSMVKTVRKRMRWGDGALPTGFLNDFLRFELHFSCSAWVLRRDSISAHTFGMVVTTTDLLWGNEIRTVIAPIVLLSGEEGAGVS